MNFFTFVFLVILGIVGVVWLANVSASKACDIRAQSFEDHEYSFFGGCMVKHNGKWLPLDNIRGEDMD